MIEAQFAMGATHDMRIFTGSALLAVPALSRPSAHTPASANFNRRIVSSQFRRACVEVFGKLHAAKAKIVGRPTDFGKRPCRGVLPAMRYRSRVARGALVAVGPERVARQRNRRVGPDCVARRGAEFEHL